MKHALITGGAIRVGRVIALTLAKAGWDLTLHYNTSQEAALSLAKEIEALGRKVILVQANLENRAEIESLIRTDATVPLTALVNNASLFEHDVNDPDGKRHTMVNYEAPRILTECLSAQLPTGTPGSVVHILDNTPIPESMGHYAASRARLHQEICAQARAYAPRLRVNAVALGPTLLSARESETHFAKLVGTTPLQQISSPEAAARAILFLLENTAVTGQILNIDSGMHLFSA